MKVMNHIQLMFKNRMLIAVLILLLVSCKKEIIDIRGSVSGRIETRADVGFSQKDLPGVKIELFNTDVKKVTYPDENGQFTFSDLPPGHYNFLFTKEGFDSVRIFNYPLIGLGKPSILFDRIYLSKPKKFKFTELKINLIHEKDATLVEGYALLENADYYNYPQFCFYFDKVPTVSNTNYAQAIRTVSSFTKFQNDTIYIKDYILKAYEKGEKLYMGVYFLNYENGTDYSQGSNGLGTKEQKGLEPQELIVK